MEKTDPPYPIYPEPGNYQQNTSGELRNIIKKKVINLKVSKNFLNKVVF